MDPQDRKAIDDLFVRINEIERRGAERDPQAEAYIAARLNDTPTSAYYLAQTVVVQQQALEAAQARIEAAERAPQSRGFFGLGGARPPAARNPWGAQPAAPAPARGGFLAGAAQTAVGVAGGVMLGNMIGGMFGADEAQAAEGEPAPDEEFDLGDSEF